MGIASHTVAQSAQLGGARPMHLVAIDARYSIAATGVRVAGIVHAVTSGTFAAARVASLALGLLFASPVSSALDMIAHALTSRAPAHPLGLMSAAQAQPAAKSPADALA